MQQVPLNPSTPFSQMLRTQPLETLMKNCVEINSSVASSEEEIRKTILSTYDTYLSTSKASEDFVSNVVLVEGELADMKNGIDNVVLGCKKLDVKLKPAIDRLELLEQISKDLSKLI